MPSYRKPVPRKCELCGEKFLATHPKKFFCQSCTPLHRAMENNHLSSKAQECLKKYLRKFGLTCDYSGVSLVLKDYASPWHCNFSYPDKGNRNNLVFAAALFAFMKGELTKPEFRYYVLQLHDHRTKHTKFITRPIIHWNKLTPGACRICGQPKLSTHALYCPTCTKIAHRMRARRFPAKTRKAIWNYIRKYGYVCYYTGMPLELINPHDPWYLSFDHCDPRDPHKVVITSFLINDMKGDLTEKEFWYYIAQLANHFRKGTPVHKIELEYWSRHYKSL